MRLPMMDARRQYAAIKGEVEPGIRQVLESGQYILGPHEQAFEQEAAAYLGVRHAIGVGSGTDALHLALKGAGIGPDDEVITTPFTFIATAEAIRYVGAVPVFVDIDERTFNLDPEAVEAAVTPRTRAIMPVHMFGQPADMGSLIEIAERRGLCVIEDCAQSFGASVEGRQTGSLGTAGGFSFFPSKNLGGAGDGGLVTTGSDEIAARVRQLRNHGSGKRYHHDVIGYNSRLDELQAVILRAKLKRIDQYNDSRRRVARRYDALLSDLPLETPSDAGRGTHVYHQYTLLSDRRDAIMDALAAEEIACAVYYPVPLHRQQAFADVCPDVSLPVSERVAARCLSLPIFPELEDDEIETVAEVVRGVF